MINRQQIVAGRAQIVAGEDELGEMVGYGYTGAAPPPPMLHPGPPHPGYGLPHPGYGHPGYPAMPHHMRDHRRHWRRPWVPSEIDIPAGAGPAAYERTTRVRVVDERPSHERQFPIGFLSPPTIPVLANSTQTITATPQVIFRSERLAVPNSIVLNFQLVDIKVGKDSQLAAPGNLPTECFSNISIGVRMQLDTAEPGITLTLVAQNMDANNSHSFASVLYGTVVE